MELALIILIIMFFGTLMFLFSSSNNTNVKKLEKKLQIVYQKAYFDGQKDCLNGKIYLQKSDNKQGYDWTMNNLPKDFCKNNLYNPNKKFKKQLGL